MIKRSIFNIVIGFIVSFITAFFIYPDANKDYSGFWLGFITGGIHGASVLFNWIISFFDETRLIKATTYSGLYNFSWWAGFITYCISLLSNLYIIITTARIQRALSNNQSENN